MLGNFSFGDYFKKDAIFFGWDFLAREVGLSGERMTGSVFREDDEAYDIWQKTMGLPASRIVRVREEDNFWAMGPTGPCGPCSEIIYDQGEATGCGRPSCAVGCDCDRFLEIWNLVFMQFNQDGGGARTPLPKPSIDTGMGREPGWARAFLHQWAAAVVREFSPAYPELARSASYIDTVALHEEKRFLETLDAGLRMVEGEFERIGKSGVSVFAGSVAFKLYDTFGFPVDLTADLCRERGVALDNEGLEAEMERQRAQPPG